MIPYSFVIRWVVYLLAFGIFCWTLENHGFQRSEEKHALEDNKNLLAAIERANQIANESNQTQYNLSVVTENYRNSVATLETLNDQIDQIRSTQPVVVERVRYKAADCPHPNSTLPRTPDSSAANNRLSEVVERMEGVATRNTQELAKMIEAYNVMESYREIVKDHNKRLETLNEQKGPTLP